MSDISHVLTAFYAEPLALLPAKLFEIRAFLEARAAGEHVGKKEIKAIEDHRRNREAAIFATVQAIDVHAARRGDGVIMSGRVAVLPVMGILSQRVGMMERSSGGISTEEIGGTLDSLMSDKQVRAICMLFDTPGGNVNGTKELGDKIRAARESKKIVGVADPLAASAGYWLLSQCSEAMVSETGQVGSIGVITAHEDVSAMQEKLGIKTTLVTSSPFKAEGNPFGPLDDVAKAELQKKVNDYHGMFVEAVAAGRGITANQVEKRFGGGRMMGAADAKSAGMVDRIGNLGDAVRRLGGEYNTAASAAAVDELPVIAAKVLPRAAVMARVRALEISGR